jgi:hypothetical protein
MKNLLATMSSGSEQRLSISIQSIADENKMYDGVAVWRNHRCSAMPFQHHFTAYNRSCCDRSGHRLAFAFCCAVNLIRCWVVAGCDFLLGHLSDDTHHTLFSAPVAQAKGVCAVATCLPAHHSVKPMVDVLVAVLNVPPWCLGRVLLRACVQSSGTESTLYPAPFCNSLSELHEHRAESDVKVLGQDKIDCE